MAEKPIAGQFTIESLALVNQHGESIDIRDLVQEFRLNESIYNKFCSATFAIADGIDLIKNFKMTGQEFVRVSIKQLEGDPSDLKVCAREFSIDKTFRIFKIDNLKRGNSQAPMQQYLFRCVEPRMFTVRRTRLSRVFRGSYSQILENIFTHSAKIKQWEFDHWEETEQGGIRYIAPNWTVGSVIDYIVSHASLGTNSAWRNGMFFFQTLNGGFRFKSIDRMFEDEFPVTFSLYPRNAGDTSVIDVNAAGGVNSQIFSVEKPQVFDTLQGTIGGAYASKMESYDAIRKLVVDDTYDIDETFKRSDKHLSGHPMLHIDKSKAVEGGEKFLTTDTMSNIAMPPTISEVDADLSPNEYNIPKREALIVNSYVTNNDLTPYGEISRIDLEINTKQGNSKLERIALLEILEQNRCVVTIPLRTDLSVGTIIKLELPPAEPSQPVKLKDSMNDDRYLITDIAVVATPQKNRGQMILQCSKESFKMPPSHVPDEDKKDTEEIA